MVVPEVTLGVIFGITLQRIDESNEGERVSPSLLRLRASARPFVVVLLRQYLRLGDS